MFDFVIGAIVGAGILTVVMMISMAKAAKEADEFESEMSRFNEHDGE